MTFAGGGVLPLEIECSNLRGGHLNHIVDQRIDTLMARTEQRPLPAGRITSHQALYFA